MKELKFKTNLNCGSCVRGVTPFLDARPGIDKWKVDLDSEDRILTVHVQDAISPAEVKATVAEAGFQAEPVGA